MLDALYRCYQGLDLSKEETKKKCEERMGAQYSEEELRMNTVELLDWLHHRLLVISKIGSIRQAFLAFQGLKSETK